jgi:hypothetical protein
MFGLRLFISSLSLTADQISQTLSSQSLENSIYCNNKPQQQTAIDAASVER